MFCVGFRHRRIVPSAKNDFRSKVPTDIAEATRPVSRNPVNASQPLHKEEPKPVLQEQPSQENAPTQNSFRDSLAADF